MPKDHLNSIKQQKKLALIHKNNNNHNQVGNVKKQSQNKQQQQHQRKLSFSDMFMRYILSYNLLSKKCILLGTKLYRFIFISII
jgi:hypothetical protein